MNQLTIDSPVGKIFLVASQKGLQGVFWREKPIVSAMGDAAEILWLAERQLQEYFCGERRQFDLPLDIIGTDFQKKVWQQLQQIEYGETRSYRDIAVAIGDNKACRAVGNANGKNPLCIVIPCHRVITSNATLGGYAGGAPTKERLLRLEGFIF